MTSIDAVVEAIDTGDPLPITTGDDLRHSLEIAVALRESARNGSAPFKLPVEDRSIMMYPRGGALELQERRSRRGVVSRPDGGAC